jgi:hypothetical protein
MLSAVNSADEDTVQLDSYIIVQFEKKLAEKQIPVITGTCITLQKWLK